MNETYVEWLVKRKTPAYLIFLKILFIMMTVCFFLAGLIFAPALLIALLMGIAAYFITMNANLEYEYLYVDKELTVDKVMNKSRRKRIATFDIGKVEIMAPIKSHQLDSYQNRNYKAVDYSSWEEKQPDVRYVFYYDGRQKVIFEPNEEMVKAILNVAPRKVFKY